MKEYGLSLGPPMMGKEQGLKHMYTLARALIKEALYVGNLKQSPTKVMIGICLNSLYVTRQDLLKFLGVW